MRTRFATRLVAWREFDATVADRARGTAGRRICEVGAGANPLLTAAEASEQGLDYVLLDASQEELAKTDDAYTKVAADMGSPGVDAGGPYDLVFSRFTAEHIASPEVFHRNVLEMLVPGGLAMHFFPTLYAPVFVLNRLLPEGLMSNALHRLQHGREPHGHTGKFRAYYRWCRGPGRRQRERFESVGFEVDEYVGYFGHSYYDRYRPLRAAMEWTADALVRRPVPLLTSYAWISLRRPE